MHSSASVGTGEEKVTLTDLAQRISTMVEFLQPFQPGNGTREKEEIPLPAKDEGSIIGHDQWLKFLRFDGTSDSLQWIYHCECYFHTYRILKNWHVSTPFSTSSMTHNCGTIGRPT
jgi:hypothetical protein